MLSMNALQSRLEHTFSHAQSTLQDAQLNASESSGDPEDMRAFTEATRGLQVANGVLGEALRAKQSITKSIIDGIQ